MHTIGWPWWRMALGLLAGLLSCGLLGVLLSRPAPPAREQALAAARSRWAAEPVGHYRMVVQAGAGCLLDAEVRDEQVVTIYRNDGCAQPARTVSDLFRLIARTADLRYCGPYRCACVSSISFVTDYDAQHGYPRRIVVRSERASDWGSRELWRFLLVNRSLPPCASSSEVEMLSVIGFTLLR